MKTFSLDGFADTDPVKEELKKVSARYYGLKERKTPLNIDDLRDCEDFLVDIYTRTFNNEKWLKAQCLGSRSMFKTSNLSLYNQEIQYLLEKYKTLGNEDDDSVTVNNLRALQLAEAKTQCALSVIKEIPGKKNIEKKEEALKNHEEYRQANKVYLRLENPSSLWYLNRQKQIYNNITPKKIFLTSPNSKTTTKVEIDFSKDATTFDKASGIEEIKQLNIRGKILEIEELNKLTQLLGKSVSSPFVSLDSLPEHDKDKCCPLLRRCCIVL